MGRNKEQDDADQARHESEFQNNIRRQEEDRRREEQKRLVGQQKKDMISLYGEQARGDLQDKLQKNTKSASARGLLYSGIKQGGEATARQETAGDVARYTRDVNQASDENMGKLGQETAQSGLQRFGQDVSNSQQQYAQALERRKSNPAGEFGKAAGSLLSF